MPARCVPYRIDDYVEGDPIPPGYVRRERIRHKLAIAGGSILGGLYAVTAAIGAAVLENSRDDRAAEKHAPMFVPVVGPFIAAATVGDDSAYLVSVLVLDGLIQSGGLAMMIAGLATEAPYLVRTGGLELDVTPIASGEVQGVGLRGRF